MWGDGFSAELLRRTLVIDALACADCGRCLRFASSSGLLCPGYAHRLLSERRCTQPDLEDVCASPEASCQLNPGL